MDHNHDAELNLQLQESIFVFEAEKFTSIYVSKNLIVNESNLKMNLNQTDFFKSENEPHFIQYFEYIYFPNNYIQAIKCWFLHVSSSTNTCVQSYNLIHIFIYNVYMYIHARILDAFSK